MAIANQLKAELGELLAKGHAKFGPVAARKAYPKDEEGGDGLPRFSVETHPLLADMPVGAASDLTFIASENSNTLDEALDRVDELNPELKNQPALQAELNYRYSHNYTPKPSPY